MEKAVVDWTKAPKGAEFYAPKLGNWYMHIDGVLHWVDKWAALGRAPNWRKSEYNGPNDKGLGGVIYRPEADEWIEHHGSNNPPVHPDTVVMYKMVGQVVGFNTLSPASELRWSHLDRGGDIIAYKVVKKP